MQQQQPQQQHTPGFVQSIEGSRAGNNTFKAFDVNGSWHVIDDQGQLSVERRRTAALVSTESVHCDLQCIRGISVQPNDIEQRNGTHLTLHPNTTRIYGHQILNGHHAMTRVQLPAELLVSCDCVPHTISSGTSAA